MAGNLQTIKETRNYISGELAAIYPGREISSLVNLILSYVLKTDKLRLLMEPGLQLTVDQYEEMIRICGELKIGKPVQYITGETLFYGCTIRVDRSVLIPRQETEELVDIVLKENKDYKGNVLDIGTGSGCIAIALALHLYDSKITALDNSAKALKKAVENARINNAKVNFIKRDILKGWETFNYKTGIIVSNPPYVMESERKYMHINVTGFEPPEALFVPDDDPLKFYRAILEAAENILEPGGRIYFEINGKMGASMLHLLDTFKYTAISIIKDINAKDRIAKGVKNG
jgi:release factor glutamine methyltransferase